MNREKQGYILHPRQSVVASPTDTDILPALLPQALWIILVTSIKDSFVLHDTFHGLKVRLSEEIPFRCQNERLGIFDRIVLVVTEDQFIAIQDASIS